MSDRFLERLASLSEKHGFVVAVDEVLTGGRRKQCLQTLNKPVSFISRVSYICLGKWLGMGMVLATAEMLKNDDVTQYMETTGTNYNEAISALDQVITNLSKISDQRKKILKVLKTDESKSWGDGILVRCNAVRTNPSEQLDINVRYLPFIVNKKKE